jgi:hypothetical protein
MHNENIAVTRTLVVYGISKSNQLPWEFKRLKFDNPQKQKQYRLSRLPLWIGYRRKKKEKFPKNNEKIFSNKDDSDQNFN